MIFCILLRSSSINLETFFPFTNILEVVW
jgi:hypothetical protein